MLGAKVHETLGKTALLVIDVQEDFCPPDGSLAVERGRDVAPAINDLLSRSFTLKVATRDWHPQNHVSFSTSHALSSDGTLSSTMKVWDTLRQDKLSQTEGGPSNVIPLWPAHCVQGTPGASIIPEIKHQDRFHLVVDKGQNADMEMYSAFSDIFGHKDSEYPADSAISRQPSASHNLAAELHKREIRSVFVTGLAGDYCVKHTALDARREGFNVYVIEDAIRSVGGGSCGWSQAKAQLQDAGIHVITMSSPEVLALRE